VMYSEVGNKNIPLSVSGKHKKKEKTNDSGNISRN